MKKIIIVSDIFAPQNRIAAVRLTKVAKYISRNTKSEIIVVTRDGTFEITDRILWNDAQIVDQWVRVKEGPLFQKIDDFRMKRVKKKVSKVDLNSVRDKDKAEKTLIYRIRFSIRRLILQLIVLLGSYSYYWNAKRRLGGLDMQYDVIISSYGPYSSHLIGRLLKKANPGSFWIADFRDPVLNYATSWPFRQYERNFAARICKNADVVTAVSVGTMDNLFLNADKRKVVITNGYDREDLSLLNTTCTGSSRLTFVYTGRLYAGRSDLTPVYRAFRELIDQGGIKSNMIKIIYAGQSKNEFLTQVHDYNLGECVQAFDVLSRKGSLELQSRAHVLLLASWNTKTEKGIITGKIFEYMMHNKPIVCTISGDAPFSDIQQMIDKGKMGFCYEEANEKSDYAKLKQYILDLYTDFVANGTISFKTNHQFVEQYNYENIATQFIQLFSK